MEVKIIKKEEILEVKEIIYEIKLQIFDEFWISGTDETVKQLKKELEDIIEKYRI